MPNLTIKGIPERLLKQPRKRAADERRSLNQEVIHLLEGSLALEEKTAQLRETVDRQVEAWRRIAGRWRSRETIAEEIRQIYSARTGGRHVKP